MITLVIEVIQVQVVHWLLKLFKFRLFGILGLTIWLGHRRDERLRFRLPIVIWVIRLVRLVRIGFEGLIELVGLRVWL